jgi:hypothetical protein
VLAHFLDDLDAVVPSVAVQVVVPVVTVARSVVVPSLVAAAGAPGVADGHRDVAPSSSVAADAPVAVFAQGVLAPWLLAVAVVAQAVAAPSLLALLVAVALGVPLARAVEESGVAADDQLFLATDLSAAAV